MTKSPPHDMSSIAHACNTDDIKRIHCGSLFIVHEFRSCIDNKNKYTVISKSTARARGTWKVQKAKSGVFEDMGQHI